MIDKETNMNVLDDSKAITCACRYEDKLYCCINNYNMLFCINCADGRMCVCTVFDDYDSGAGRLYCDMKRVDDSLVLVPECSPYIIMYNLRTQETTKFNLLGSDADRKIKYNGKLKFWTSVVIRKSVYLLPRRYPGIIELDTQTKEMHCYNEWIPEMEEYIYHDRAYFSYDYFVEGNCIYLASYNSDVMAYFDVESKSVKLVHASKSREHYFALEKLKNKLWISEVESRQIAVKGISDFITETTVAYPAGFVLGNNNFRKFIARGKYLYAMPFQANMMLKIDAETYQAVSLKQFDSAEGEPVILSIWEDDDRIGFYNNAQRRIEIFDPITDTFAVMKVTYDEKTKNAIARHLLSDVKNFIMETDDCGLGEYIDFLTKVNNEMREEKMNA